jgi:regulator of nonsense transcripts 2
LTTFLKSYSKPFLGVLPAMPQNKQISADIETDTNPATVDESQSEPPTIGNGELVEQDVRDRFKRMCEGYFDNICKKLLIEHKVSVLQ